MVYWILILLFSLKIDIMAENLKGGKEGVSAAIETLAQIQRSRPNALLTRTFFEAKKTGRSLFYVFIR